MKMGVLLVKMTDACLGFLKASQGLSSQTQRGEGEGTHGIWRSQQVGGNQLRMLRDRGGSCDCMTPPVTEAP